MLYQPKQPPCRFSVKRGLPEKFRKFHEKNTCYDIIFGFKLDAVAGVFLRIHNFFSLQLFYSTPVIGCFCISSWKAERQFVVLFTALWTRNLVHFPWDFSANVKAAYHVRIRFMRLCNISLCEKCPYLEPFWSVFSRIRTEYGETRSISLSVFSWNTGKYGPEKIRIRTFFTQCIRLISCRRL